LSLAGAVAEGLPFHGRETERGVVIYLAVEAPQSIKTRIQAMQRYYGKRFKDIAVVPVPLNFYSSEGDAAAVIALIKEIEATRGPVRLVVGDTLARISAGANENSGEDMGPVMARFSAISEQTDASVLIIHHNGKDQARGARGWSGIRAHVDTEIEVVEADKIHTATITKQRSLDSKGEALVFTLKVMEMGLGKFGNVSTTCVAVPSDEKPVTRERKKVAADKAIIEDAWRWSGSQYDCHNRKYIARKDLIEYMVDVMAKPESSAQQEVKPGKNRLIGRLVSEKIVESFPGGWSILPDDERLEV
jgi:RecA-family ATPase